MYFSELELAEIYGSGQKTGKQNLQVFCPEPCISASSSLQKYTVRVKKPENQIVKFFDPSRVFQRARACRSMTEHATYATHTKYAPNPTKCLEIVAKTRCLANALCGQETSQNAGVSVGKPAHVFETPGVSRRDASHFKPTGSIRQEIGARALTFWLACLAWHFLYQLWLIEYES